MMIKQSIGLKARYKLRILNADRLLKWESDWIPNLITDLGLDRIGNNAGGAFGNFCRIGTGTTTPAFTDTALVSQSASTNNVVSSSSVNAGAPDYQTTRSSTFEFAQGAVVGNMAELGVGWTASTASTLATRSRILDGSGNPTTITVLASEILQVTYQMTQYPQITDSSGTVVIQGITYNYTARLFNAATVLGFSLPSVPFSVIGTPQAFSTSTLGSITSTGPSGASFAFSGGALQAYTNGNFFRDYTLTASISQANATGGIGSITTMLTGSVGNWSHTQISFSPVIPKDNTKTMSLTLRTSWARH